MINAWSTSLAWMFGLTRGIGARRGKQHNLATFGRQGDCALDSVFGIDIGVQDRDRLDVFMVALFAFEIVVNVVRGVHVGNEWGAWRFALCVIFRNLRRMTQISLSSCFLLYDSGLVS